MFLKVPLITDWQAITHAYKYQRNDNLQCANRKQCQNDYSGITSSEESARSTKLGVRMEGPSTIERVLVNGNLTTLLHKGITECINIYRDLSYC